jgi:hypothetical protein
MVALRGQGGGGGNSRGGGDMPAIAARQWQGGEIEVPEVGQAGGNLDHSFW